MESGDQEAESSSKATVALASPLAMALRYFCFPGLFEVPASSGPAIKTVLKNGPGSSVRPISSRVAAISTMPIPNPPYSSGRIIPFQPCSAILRHRAGSKAVAVSMSFRTSVMGHSAARNFRTVFFRVC